MELSDITSGIMLASQAGAINHHRRRAERATAFANDATVAAAIHGAASGAHADVASRLRIQLIAADLNLERLEDKVDTLTNERSELIRHIGSLLDEVEALRARLH